jgi:hypothetical protein
MNGDEGHDELVTPQPLRQRRKGGIMKKELEHFHKSYSVSRV